jgi:hypothetical protein
VTVDTEGKRRGRVQLLGPEVFYEKRWRKSSRKTEGNNHQA